MTPFMTPHQSSQTPRYGQATPTQHGQFLRPGAPITNNNNNNNNSSSSSNNRSNYRASPYSGASPRDRGAPQAREQSRRITQDEEDWDKASNAWDAHSRMKGSTPRADNQGRTTPRG